MHALQVYSFAEAIWLATCWQLRRMDFREFFGVDAPLLTGTV
jgi:hypothetical protein